ncbi:MAG: hypothetical protein ACK2VA_11890 [Anaerolineae bacterium]|jgi:hypothetical protein
MQTIYHTSFDEGFEPQQGEQLLLTPKGWIVAWSPGEKPGPVRPEVQPEIRSRGDRGMLTGENGVKICHAYAFFDAVLYRCLAAAPGRRYRLSAWTTAESQGGLACQVGIHPAGELDWADPFVQWSTWYGTDDDDFLPYRWQSRATEVVAEKDLITIFLRCTARDAVQVNAGFFDDVAVESDEGQINPSPAPGSLADYLDQLRATHAQLGADVHALESYIESQQRLCLLID